MLGVVCIGVVIQRFVDNDQPGWPLIVMIGLVAAAWIVHYTHSKAALVTPLIAGVMLAAVALMGDALARWRRPLYFAGVVVFALVAVAVTLAGRTRGDLFASSMTFRWHYWIGAARIVERHPMVGIGWGNFGMHYVGVRLPVASEEVKDPHNLIVRAFAELGIVGGVLMIAWLARLWWELCAAKSLALKSDLPMSSYGRGFSMKTFATICGFAMVLNIAASIDFSSATPDAGWFILLQLMKRALFFGLLLLGYAAVTLRSSAVPELDDRPAPWVMYAMLVALAVFLLHNLIDFSMFEPGVMGVFAALVGASLGLRAQAAEYDSRARALVGLSLAVLLWLAAAIGLFAPVALAESSARRGDELIRAQQPRAAAMQFRRAFEQLWIPNADYPYRAAIALARAGAPADQIRVLLDTAIAANPMDGGFHRTRAKLELEQSNPDANRIIESYQEATALDPNDVWLHLEFADALVQLGMKAHALDEYRQALRYNDLLGPDEPKRLPPAELQRVQGKIKSIEP
jgi:O-antigen ligase